MTIDLCCAPSTLQEDQALLEPRGLDQMNNVAAHLMVDPGEVKIRRDTLSCNPVVQFYGVCSQGILLVFSMAKHAPRNAPFCRRVPEVEVCLLCELSRKICPVRPVRVAYSDSYVKP